MAKKFYQTSPITCGITICRAIVYHQQGNYLSEKQMLAIVRNLSLINEEVWKKEFLNGTGAMPTPALVDLLKKGFNIEYVKDDTQVLTTSITQEDVRVIFHYGGNHYHSVLIDSIEGDRVYYLETDHSRPNIQSMPLTEFDEHRRPKNSEDKRALLEILRPV